MASQKRTWYIGMVLVVILVVAGGWMLVVSPLRTTTAETRTTTDGVVVENAVLEKKVAALRAEFARIDELRDEVRADRLRIPTTLEVADILDALDGAASDAEVLVAEVKVDDLAAVLPSRETILLPSERAAAEKAKDEAKSKPKPTEQPSADATPAGTDADNAGKKDDGSASQKFVEAKIPGFSALPVTLTVIGTVEQTLAFTETLQGGIARNFMVGAYATTVGAGKGVNDDADEKGLMTTVIDGWFYVLESSYDPDAAAKPDAKDDPEKTPALPSMGSRNPFELPKREG